METSPKKLIKLTEKLPNLQNPKKLVKWRNVERHYVFCFDEKKWKGAKSNKA